MLAAGDRASARPGRAGRSTNWRGFGAERAAGDQARRSWRRRRRSRPRRPWRSPRRRPSGRRRGRPRRRAPAPAPCRGTARRRWSRAWCRRSSRGRSAARRRGPARSRSMSRAVSTVLKVPRASPYSSAQPSATSLVSAKASSSCSSVVGRGSAATMPLLHARRGCTRPAWTARRRAGRSRRCRSGCSTSVGQGQRQADRGVGAGGARAAGVDHQRADPVGLPGHHDPDQEQRQRGALGLVVADRHLGAAALEGQVAVAAGLAGDRAAGSARCSRSTRSARPSARRAVVAAGVDASLGEPCRRTRCSRTGPGSRRGRWRAGSRGRPARPRCRRMITSLGAARRRLQTIAPDRGTLSPPAPRPGRSAPARPAGRTCSSAASRSGRQRRNWPV